MPIATNVPILTNVTGPWNRQTPPIVGPAASSTEALNEQNETSSLEMWTYSRNEHEVFEFDMADPQFPSSFVVTSVTLRYSHTRNCTGGLRVWTGAIDDVGNLVDGIDEFVNFDQYAVEATVATQSRSTLGDGSRWLDYDRICFQLQHEGLLGGEGSSHLLHWVTADIEWEDAVPCVTVDAPDGTGLEFPTVDWTYIYEAPQSAYQIEIREALSGEISALDADAWWHYGDFVVGAADWVDRAAGHKMAMFNNPAIDSDGKVLFTQVGEEYGVWPENVIPNADIGESNTLVALLTMLEEASADNLSIYSTRSSPDFDAAGLRLFEPTSDDIVMRSRWHTLDIGIAETSSRDSEVDVEHLVASITGLVDLATYTSFVGLHTGGPERPIAGGAGLEAIHEDTTGSSDDTAVTSHEVAMPPVVDVGNILVVAMMFNSDTVVSQNDNDGWIRLMAVSGGLDEAGTLEIWAKVAKGDEANTTVTFITSESRPGTFQCLRLSATSGGLVEGVDYEFEVASGESDQPRSPEASETWASDDNLWLSIIGYRWHNANVTTYPAFFELGAYETIPTNTGGGGTGTASASRRFTTDTLEPDFFILDQEEYWHAVTLVMAPGGTSLSSDLPVEVGRHQEPGEAFYGEMAAADFLLFQDQELTETQLDALKVELQTNPPDPNVPEGEIHFSTPKQIGSMTRSVPITSPLVPGTYRSWLKVWSLHPNGLELESPWYSNLFVVEDPTTPYGDPDSVTAVLNEATGAAEITISPPSSGDPIGDTILLERQKDGEDWVRLGLLPSDDVNDVVYVDAFAPFQADVVYRAQFTSTENHPPSEFIEAAYREDSPKWWLINPDDLTLTVNPVPRDYSADEIRTATTSRQSGSTTTSTSGGLGHDIEVVVWLKTEAERVAMETILDSVTPLRLVDILGVEYYVAISGNITKSMARSAPSNDATTGLRDFHTWGILFVEVDRDDG